MRSPGFLRGQTLSQTGAGDALESFNRATALRPDFTPAIEARAYHRSFRLLTEGERAQLVPMLNDFDAWVIFRPESARSYTARGMGFLFAGAYSGTQPDLRDSAADWLARAGADFDHAGQLGGADTPGLLLRKGMYWIHLADYQAAADALGRPLPADPGRGGAAVPGAHAPPRDCAARAGADPGRLWTTSIPCVLPCPPFSRGSCTGPC